MVDFAYQIVKGCKYFIYAAATGGRYVYSVAQDGLPGTLNTHRWIGNQLGLFDSIEDMTLGDEPQTRRIGKIALSLAEPDD
ncbi:MAG TPA: hypothetical protein VEU97_05665 [Ktedonobacteraceae bacterium]|nr:hypothetical protein [Ktedonobacteraceae bacterium]